ncbi:hypothetical protein VaNZ11_002502, partial [Volvox africanus]
AFRRMAWSAVDFLVRLVNRALPVALPTSSVRIWWTLWMLTLVLYSAVHVPLQIAFQSWRQSKVVIWLDWMVSISFCLDILVNLRTSIATPQGDIVRTPQIIALHYLRGMFVLDLVSALPLDVIVNISTHGDAHEKLYWVGLLRLPRFVTMLSQLDIVVPVKYFNLVSVTKLLVIMILMTHWAACVWYFLSLEIQGKWPWIFTVDCHCHGDMDKYLYAFYRSFLIMLGDRPPTNNNVERVFTLVLLFLGACFYAIVVSQIDGHCP